MKKRLKCTGPCSNVSQSLHSYVFTPSNTHTYSRHTAGVTLSHVELNESRQRLHVPDERAIWGSRVTARASRESEVVANGVQKRVFLPVLLLKKKKPARATKEKLHAIKTFSCLMILGRVSNERGLEHR